MEPLTPAARPLAVALTVGLLTLTGISPATPQLSSERRETTPEAPHTGPALQLPQQVGADPTQSLALGPNEPTYLVFGGRGDSGGKLQFSFQYRLFGAGDEDGDGDGDGERPSRLRGLHFAYTQTAIWDVFGSSNPIKDSSYRPSVYWQRVEPGSSWQPDFLRAGYEHDSNGEGGDWSRSLDSAFLFPGWLFDLGSKQLLAGAKLHAPISVSQHNRDIHEYRGYLELYARYGREDDWIGTARLRRRSLELTLSYPLREAMVARTGTYFYVELFHGYGETLLEYDRHSGPHLRVGFSIVR